jgi:hypothetical protein
MGHFNGLNDDDAELLIGGAVDKPSSAFNGSSYGQFKKSGAADANPGSFYGGTNYGTAKKA